MKYTVGIHNHGLRESFFAPAIVGNLGGNGRKRKTFLHFLLLSPHNRRVTIAIGASLNAGGILLGAIIGLALRRPMSGSAQLMLRNILGALALFVGFWLVWQGINGPFPSCVGQFFIALLAVVLGNLLGKVLALQKMSNRLGREAAGLIAAAQKGSAQKALAGFNACTILFCVAPLGIVGAIDDGVSEFYWLLAVKAVMDAMAMTTFAKMFRWPVVMSTVPVFLWLSLITLACRLYITPLLNPGHADSLLVASGLVTFAIAIVIFEVRKVELANYLPALALAPLLTWLFKTI
jgi:uncharacterized membrane protein YqgA involved in biofilm formation